MSISLLQIAILFIILVGPILIPLLRKKWIWLITMIIGYGLYFVWGVYLYVNSEITEFGTGYGLFFAPYIAGLSILGITLERNIKKDKN